MDSKNLTSSSAAKLVLERFAQIKALCSKHGSKINRAHLYGEALIEHLDVVQAALSAASTKGKGFTNTLTDAEIKRIAADAGLEPSEITGEAFYALRSVADYSAYGI